MSTREQTHEPGIMMVCDGPLPGGLKCPRQVRRGVRIMVPSRTPEQPDHKPMRITTTIHFCEEHRNSLRLERFWTEAMKVSVEGRAKQIRPADFKPDFEKAWVDLVLVTTPEYRAFMEKVGVKHVAA